jgi:hypothetical protein
MNAFTAGIIAFGAALNVAIGYLVSMLKLPFYLDSIGTVLISVLGGWMYGVITGLASLMILAVTVAPTVIAYAGTAVLIGVLSALFGRFGFLRSTKVTIAGGVLLGITGGGGFGSCYNSLVWRRIARRVRRYHRTVPGLWFIHLEKCCVRKSCHRYIR